MQTDNTPSRDQRDSDRRTALGYVAEAFAEAELDGLDGDHVVQAAVLTAFRHLVRVYGEEAAATYADALPDRIRAGCFSTAHRH